MKSPTLLRAKKNANKEISGHIEIAGSGLFSASWYLARYCDVTAAGMDPVDHYLRHGAAEGRDPGPDFCTRAYLQRYPDVTEAGLNPLLHYIRHGRSEGRNPGPLRIEQPMEAAWKDFERHLELVRTSNLFDAKWYREHYPAVKDDPAVDYLSDGYRLNRNPGPEFNTAFYLATYRDVARAGKNPLVHYLLYGKDEGRMPKAGRARSLERKLWSGFSRYALRELETLKHSGREPEPERVSAAWSLMRWFYTRQEYSRVLDNFVFACHLRGELKNFKRWTLPAAHSLLKLGNRTEARNMLKQTLEKRGANPDLCLAMANTFFTPQADSSERQAGDDQRLAWINRVFTTKGLTAVGKADEDAPLALGNLATPALSKGLDTARAKISVIMPAYNAAGTIAIALESLLRQSWDNLEILVVDDCSSDATYEVVRAWAARDNRIVPLRHETNQGAYPARNTAIKRATGDFITVHDCDDWSHPEKLETQILPLLQDADVLGTFTNWVRVDEEMNVLGGWRPWDNLIEFNHSSFLFRRQLMDELGQWDNVRVGGDTEFIWRAEALYGKDRFLRLHGDVPFSFSLACDTSLTLTKATHVKTIDFGLRRLYREAARWWHKNCAQAGGLHLCHSGDGRTFPAPAANLRASKDEKLSVVFIADYSTVGDDGPPLFEAIRSVVGRKEKTAVFHWPDYEADGDRPLDDRLFELAGEFEVRILSPGEEISSEQIVVMQPEILKYQLDTIPKISCKKILVVTPRDFSNQELVQSSLEQMFGIRGTFAAIHDIQCQLNVHLKSQAM